VRGVARAAFWLALVVWVGEVVFLSMVVAPVLFGSLPRSAAGDAMAALFPAYYAVATVSGVLAVTCAIVLWRASGGAPLWRAVVVMLAVMLVATVYAGGVVHPRAQALRSAMRDDATGAESRAAFDRLHRRAVQLNAVVLLLGIASVCVAAQGATRLDQRTE
jgi:hypothetical protein